MSTTRDEILAALTEHADGLTSKELAPLCPACECDPLIVGRVIASLRSEDLIHAGTELREGGTIWILGPEKKDEKVEHVGLGAFNERGATHDYAKAARDIAAMRQPTTARRAPDRAPMPSTTTAPAGPVVHQEEVMADKAKVLAAINAAPEGMRRGDIDKLAGKKSASILRELLKEKSIRITGRARGTRYVGKGAPPQPERARSAPRATRANGNNGSPYAAALADLQEKRSVLADQLTKIDKAIEAVEALA